MKCLLILKLPPPFGGGELMHQIIFDQLKNNKEYHFIIIRNEKRNKSNQNKFGLWKIKESFILYYKLLIQLIHVQPDIVLFSAGKDLIPFLRDCYIILLSKIFGAKIIAEIGEKVNEKDARKSLLSYFLLPASY